MKKPTYRAIGCAALGLLLEACGGQLDAGYDVPHGPLPVDERSALVVINDGPRDNWQGEYAALLAATGRARLVGIIVNASANYPDLEDNVLGFRQMVDQARESGMRFLPDPTASVASTLVRPTTGVIEDTVPNRSEGARLILEAASRYGTSVHPLAIATGSALTDVADAYLMDPTLPERAVLVSSLGTGDANGGVASGPNGNIDGWATFIAATRMRYVQVNGYYEQLEDVPEARVAELPDNPFGAWIAAKRAEILELKVACDQISVLGAVRPWFAQGVTRMRAELGEDGATTVLVPDDTGQAWHVAASDSTRARDELWSELKDPATFR